MGKKVDVPIPKLRGLKESPQRLETLQALYHAFESYHCRGRTLITFHSTSLLHYLFEVRSPQGLEYICIPHTWFPDRILKALQETPQWCVFVSWNYLEFPWAHRRQLKASAEPVMEYLRSHSQKIVPLARDKLGDHYYNDFVLYIGPKEESVKPTAAQFGH